ncbi:unnamed protein product [Ranitomeya imitator]|uniref:Peptidase S26 domain-containing protein n=1 Tax=Ranitomeya imitator TaxID=111125 RepID=A0ABN9M1J8_9NEOB|nr:unnamed protein product [Ranitomeya imitator]
MIRKVIGKTLGFLGYAIQYGCIAHCTFEYLGEIVVCSGPSMEPTIQNYDILVCDNLSRHLYSIHKIPSATHALAFISSSRRRMMGAVVTSDRRGDIVIAKSPNKPSINICKRVIGLEGDKVCTSSPSDFIKRHTYVSTPPALCTWEEWLQNGIR